MRSDNSVDRLAVKTPGKIGNLRIRALLTEKSRDGLCSEVKERTIRKTWDRIEVGCGE
jgi:hypothetical protein